MTAPGDERSLKLHTAPDGEIWLADGTRAPRPSGMQLDRFMDSGVWRQPVRVIRVLGLSYNAPLLTALFPWQSRHHIERLELAGPLVCTTVDERRDPEVALFRMRQCLLPSALGGWHIMTDRDYASYSLVTRLQTTGDWADESALSILMHHPAWYDLTFIRGLNPRMVARLLARIIDPRWFVDTRRPLRIARLENYLGLAPSVQRVASSPTTSLNFAGENCRLVLQSWRSADPPGRGELEIPENFLWRIWFAAGQGVRGDLRASQAFVCFLRHTWLAALCVRPGSQDGLFNPDVIFNNEAELSAYRDHAAKRPLDVVSQRR